MFTITTLTLSPIYEVLDTQTYSRSFPDLSPSLLHLSPGPTLSLFTLTSSTYHLFTLPPLALSVTYDLASLLSSSLTLLDCKLLPPSYLLVLTSTRQLLIISTTFLDKHRIIRNPCQPPFPYAYLQPKYFEITDAVLCVMQLST